MKLLIVGREGQLARCLAEALASRPEIEAEFVGRPDLDLAVPGSAERVITAKAPDIVINAAAYTAVDKAESEPELAFRINADAAGELAAAARMNGAAIAQFSTDYVFDGAAAEPYTEASATGPINIYGHSKLMGEEQVRSANPDHLIIRTSWLFSPYGANFVKTMVRLAVARDEVRVVADQRGCPTSAPDLAQAVLLMIDRWRGGPALLGGTYHVAGSDTATWAELAQAVMVESERLNGPAARVVPITTEEFPTEAARPKCSILDNRRLLSRFGLTLPDWRESLGETVRRLLRGS